MKFFTAITSLAVIAFGATNAQLEDRFFQNEPVVYEADSKELTGPESEAYFKDFEGYKTDVANSTTRELQTVEVVVAAFQVAAAVAPLIAQIIAGNKKECQQLACWISTSSRTCGLAVAEKVQAEITKGRDRYAYESIQSNGMWVRYWRTKFEPIDRLDIASGKCSNGAKFTVTNCQSTGRVHC